MGLMVGFNVGDYIPWLSWMNFIKGGGSRVLDLQFVRFTC